MSAVVPDGLVLRPNVKATVFRIGVDVLFAVLAAALVLVVATVGAFKAGAVAIAVIAIVLFLRALHGHWKEWRDLKHVAYVMDENGLTVVNERSGEKELYRASQVTDVEVFKVPFGYGMRIYRDGERRDHWKRIFGVRIYPSADDYSVGGEEKGLLALRSSEDVNRVIACLSRTSLAAASA